MVDCECCYFPKRYIIVTCTFAGMLLVHAMRVNMAVAVITFVDADAHQKVGSSEAVAALPDVVWDSYMVGFLHAAFYIGYLVTQIPGGYLCQILPSHRLFGGCILVSSGLNLVLPAAVSSGAGFWLPCAVRAAQGLSEGLLFPSAYALLRHWTTPEERSRMGALMLTGVYIGPVIGLSLSGYLAHVYGWMYIFYVHGAMGVLWFLFWFGLSYETPATHPGISKEELLYVTERQGQTAVIYQHDSVPWKEILLSLPVNALNVCNFGRSFVFFFLLTNEPTFLNVFEYTLAENGLLSALPHALMGCVAIISGPIADLLISDVFLTTTQVRKLFTCVGFGTEALCLYFLAILNDGTSALIFLTIGVGISGFTISGWQINHLDLAPRYASVLVGITTAVGTVAGIINPIIVGWMTTDQTIEQWHNVFLMTASVIAACALFYLFFGSGFTVFVTGETQSWSEPKPPPQTVVQPDMSGLLYGTFPAQVKGDKIGISITDQSKKLDQSLENTHRQQLNMNNMDPEKANCKKRNGKTADGTAPSDVTVSNGDQERSDLKLNLNGKSNT